MYTHQKADIKNKISYCVRPISEMMYGFVIFFPSQLKIKILILFPLKGTCFNSLDTLAKENPSPAKSAPKFPQRLPWGGGPGPGLCRELPQRLKPSGKWGIESLHD